MLLIALWFIAQETGLTASQLISCVNWVSLFSLTVPVSSSAKWRLL